MSQIFALQQLGTVDYAQAHRIQADLWRRRVRGEIPDTLLLLEHPLTITAGQAADLADLLVDWSELRRQGVAFFFADRGGSLTCHAPGQFVAYPIVDLRQRDRDVLQYVRDLEEAVIRTLADMSLSARRDERQAGVWVRDAKIASIGVAVRKWVTTHGVAINVCNDLRPFSLIRPCGLANQAVTSVSLELGREVTMEHAVEYFTTRFAEVFNAGRVEGATGASRVAAIVR
jgi:lipoate-protein ligase B